MLSTKTSQNGKEREMTVLLEEQHLTGKRNRDATVAIDRDILRVTHSALHTTSCVNGVGSVVTMQCVVKHRGLEGQNGTSDTTNPKVKTCYKVTGNRQGENRDDYAFTVDNTGNESGVVDLKVGGVAIISILIDSGATCNIMDKATWEMLKKDGVKCVSRRTNKKLFAYGQEKPIDVLGTFVSEIECENNDRKCEGEFTVIKGTGKTLLGRRTAEKLDVLRVGPLEHPHTYSVTEEGTDVDIRRKFADVFAGVGKLKNYQLKLHVDKTVQPIAQPVRRLPFSLREKVEKKLDELLEKEIIEEVSNTPTTWLSPVVVVPKPDGDIRICVDMRRANEAIVRERETSYSNHRGSSPRLKWVDGVQQARSQMGIPPSVAGRGVTGNNYILDTPRIVQTHKAQRMHQK